MTNPIQAATGQSCLTRFAEPGEGRAARRLIRLGLAKGYTVSVNDGEEWTVRRSTNQVAIIDALCSTGEDVIRFDDEAGRIGIFVLIYGNDPDGSELISDHTDNVACNELYAATYPD